MRHAQLRAFHHVARTGGFSRAAKALNLSQPSLSDQVRRLETAHDVLLFRRDGRQIRLTEAGESLFRLTREYFEVEERIGGFLDRSRAVPAGNLRIVADSAIHVTGLVGRFRERHPDVFISIRTGNTARVVEAVRGYDAEIGVVGAFGAGPEFDTVDLGRAEIRALVAREGAGLPEGPVSLEKLRGHALVFREEGSRTRAAVEEAARLAGIALTPAIEVEGREAMREIVAAGAGVGFISEAEAGRDDRLRLVPIDGLGLAMPETLITLRARADVPVIRSFLKTAKETP